MKRRTILQKQHKPWYVEIIVVQITVASAVVQITVVQIIVASAAAIGINTVAVQTCLIAVSPLKTPIRLWVSTSRSQVISYKNLIKNV